MEAPKYQQPALDPTLQALDAKTQSDNVAALQNTAAIDTASIAARYGTRVAMSAASVAGSPAVSRVA